jgi:hypothetical protein
MTITLFATVEQSYLKLAWSDSKSRPWPYCVLLSSVEAESERVRSILNSITQRHIRTDELNYREFLPQLQRAGASLYRALFDAKDNPSAAQDAEDIVRNASRKSEISIFSEVCIPWGFLFSSFSKPEEFKGEISDFEGFWSLDFVLTLRGPRSSPMAPQPRDRDKFKMLHALHKERFNSALSLLPLERQQEFDELVHSEIGNVTNWDDCREKWETIEDNDSLLHIFGHSDGEKVFLKDEASDDTYCLEADRFKNLFAKHRHTRSVTICFLNGCRTGAGPVGESFLDVLFDIGFQGFIGTEAEVSNKFAAEYAADFMGLLWKQGKSVREAFDILRDKHFPLSLFYSCYAHPDFRIGMPKGGSDAASSRSLARN